MKTTAYQGDDHYEVLGISPDATEQEIRKAYKKLALRYHPDKQKTPEDRAKMTPLFTRVSNAHEVLMDKGKRRLFDMQRQFSSASAATGKTSWRGYGGGSSGSSSSQHKKKYDQQNSQAAGGAGSKAPHQEDNFYGPRQAGSSKQANGFRWQEMPRQSSRKNAETAGQSYQQWTKGENRDRQDSSSRSQHKKEQWDPQGAKSNGSSRKPQSRPPFGAGAKPSYPPKSSTQTPRGNQRPQSSNPFGCRGDHYSHQTGSQHRQEDNGSGYNDGSGSRRYSSSSSTSSQQRVFGIRKDGQPCRRCIRQGGYCYQHKQTGSGHHNHGSNSGHEHSQSTGTNRKSNASSSDRNGTVYGIRLDGQPCKRCLRQGGFCYQHKDQQEKGREPHRGSSGRAAPKENGASRQKPRGRIFGVCRDGRPCIRCIHQGKYCYQHAYQE